jgi:hypothetical protein
VLVYAGSALDAQQSTLLMVGRKVDILGTLAGPNGLVHAGAIRRAKDEWADCRRIARPYPEPGSGVRFRSATVLSAISRSQWNAGFGADSGRSRGGPFSVRAGG